MTLATYITTVALSMNDILFFGFVALFVVGPWISKAMKKSGQQKRPPASRRPTASQTPSRELPSATDLALRRQKRLQELAQRRRAAASGQSSPTTPEPGNLSMAQRLERKRAKAMYEKRARKLHQQQAQSQPTPRQPRATPPPAQQPLQHRSRQQRLIREHNRQIKQQKRRKRVEALRKMAQQKRDDAKQPLSQRRSKQSQIDAEHKRGIVHRHVPDAPTTSTKTKQTSPIGPLNAQSLRHAFVLKEILDPPVALRQPNSESNY